MSTCWEECDAVVGWNILFLQFLLPFSPMFVPFYRFFFIIIIIIPTFILFHYTYICAQAETSSFHPLAKENDRSEEIIRKGKKNPSIRAVWKRDTKKEAGWCIGWYVVVATPST